MLIPNNFEEILKTNQTLHSIVLDVISSFEGILKDNKLYFFEEYTDHGIEHIENVLKSCEFIISRDSFNNLTPNEIATLILSIILHDLGMHLEFSSFKAMLDGKYDNAMVSSIDKKTWKQLWDEYLNEAKRFSSIQKKNIFGKSSTPFKIPDLSSKDDLTGIDKKLIGEFIRRHHGRVAHEIAVAGIHGNNSTIQFANDKLDNKNKHLAGLLARSHSMDIRDCYSSLEELGNESWRNPLNINIIFLMVVLRIGDYIQIDSKRVNSHLLKIKTFSSPISTIEHQTHLAIESINFNQPDSQKIYVHASPVDSEQFVKIFNLIKDIQRELDISWAILGEIYGFLPQNKPSIKFRRINSNLTDSKFIEKLGFVPEKIGFQVDNNLSKLLVAPLYGDNPTYGVRELIQNAVDSCIERKEIEYTNGNFKYTPKIQVSINRIDNNSSLFLIEDNGKGMNQYEILNYFLSVGTSFRQSMDWKRQFIGEDGKSKIKRNGKFGIGVLAAFLLGDEIIVNTSSINSKSEYSFRASIDSQFINIKKESNLTDFGVGISIILDNEKREKLMRVQESFSKGIIWTDWYINDDPEINFTLDGIEIKRTNTIELSSFFTFSTNEFDKIFWKYPKNSNFYSSYHPILACNGIRISNSYQASYYTNEYRSLLITRKPSLIINDKDGVLPLKLDRNELDSNEFPFEKELLAEISKFYIAQLLTLNIESKDIIQKNVPIFQTEILFGIDGFTINCDYFINGLEKKYNFIRILTESSELNLNYNNYANCLFLVVRETIKLSYQEGNVAPAHGARILISIEKFSNLFNENNNRLSKWVKKNIKVEFKDDKYVIYRTLNFDRSTKILNESILIDSQFLNKIDSIQELSPKFFRIVSKDETKELFNRYIKDNFIIPYDLEKRKKIFHEAFSELKHFMNLT